MTNCEVGMLGVSSRTCEMKWKYGRPADERAPLGAEI